MFNWNDDILSLSFEERFSDLDDRMYYAFKKCDEKDSSKVDVPPLTEEDYPF